VLLRLQLDLCSVLLSRSFSQGRRKLDKDFRDVCYVHNIFHVSQLKKCLRVPKEQLPMEDLDAKEDLSYQVYPIKILETSERVTRNKKIKMCKVQWGHHTEEEASWEIVEELKAEFLNLFSDPSESRGRDSF
jgi:hypothetical protein